MICYLILFSIVLDTNYIYSGKFRYLRRPSCCLGNFSILCSLSLLR